MPGRFDATAGGRSGTRASDVIEQASARRRSPPRPPYRLAVGGGAPHVRAHARPSGVETCRRLAKTTGTHYVLLYLSYIHAAAAAAAGADEARSKLKTPSHRIHRAQWQCANRLTDRRQPRPNKMLDDACVAWCWHGQHDSFHRRSASFHLFCAVAQVPTRACLPMPICLRRLAVAPHARMALYNSVDRLISPVTRV